MKKYVEELERALTICSLCPKGKGWRDYLEEKRRQEAYEQEAREKGIEIPETSTRRSFMGDSLDRSRLLEAIIDTTHTDVVDNRTEEQKMEDEFNNDISSTLSMDYGLSCKHLKQWQANLCIERDFDYPVEESEILRILDKLSDVYYYECPLLGHYFRKHNRMEEKTITVLARYDFFLLEHGIDIMPLCEVVGLDIYKREESIWECGYSYSLVNHYLEKLASTGTKALTSADIIKGSPELTHAFEEDFITADGVLLRPASDFVRFCVNNGYFKPWGRPAFRRISGVLKRGNGTPIGGETLAQAYCDNKDTKQGDTIKER